ncbi:coproporphyrinogen III oxidase [Myxococcus stipitatus DSM 14675]|uniref:Coproporphyrinogen III oxidase n=1 Tax=Myxococcus stipitatus (strain DSM 14675 / JCM 12634 / Mx s8) TaxID=1278073 RepID=L7UE03_MYXSD|nr:STM4012 family radical SAM protein [Myxococcus stipitatus]AGC44669.1 coproporphyrinogen III oxidase [Myxococcus stipitatus DSM 14675]
MKRLEEMLEGSPYVAYLYGYPHKTAYRPFAPALSLESVWAEERRDALFLYFHVPFCEMRCGFCNLFTAAGPKQDVVDGYLAALERETRRVKEALGTASFARLAVGGGTPTLLDVAGLHRVFDLAEDVLGADPHHIPVSVEVSPETVDAEKLRVLRARGTDRVSMGVQSFIEAEVAAVKRPQKTAQVESALDLIRSTGFPTLNLDLIYGMEGQTVESFLFSLRAALRFSPEEVYLYPLYVRPLTFLGKKSRAWDDLRLSLYRAGREFLLSEGYTQVSMRMFRARHAPDASGPVYRCQEDGMVGLGCGARSYTGRVHYSSEYAVGSREVRSIIASYSERTSESFGEVGYGFRLSGEERRRRHMLLSLLADGVDFAAYRERFCSDVLEDFPELLELEAHGLARREGVGLVLTAAGVERSDLIGPWLHSEGVRALSEEYAWR